MRRRCLPLFVLHERSIGEAQKQNQTQERPRVPLDFDFDSSACVKWKEVAGDGSIGSGM